MQKIIIGGSSGIGASIIEEWEKQGAAYTAFSRENKNNLSNWQQLDITKTETFLPLNNEADTLIYCPGTILLKPIHLLKQEDFVRDMEVNFFGAVRSVQHFLPNLKKAKNASIIFFSSVAAQTGMPYHASIAAAKGALEAFTRSLAAELAPAIRVNAIALSLTDTPLASRLLNTEAKRNVSAGRHPLNRIGDAKNVASLALWLCSSHAQFITGQIIQMDGGISSVKLL